MARPNQADAKLQDELKVLRSHYRYLLEAVKSGIVVLDAEDMVAACNEAALTVLGLTGARQVGKRLLNTEFVRRCPGLPAKVDAIRAERSESAAFEHRVKIEGEERVIQLTLRPILSDSTGNQIGTIIHFEDITSHQRFQTTIEQLASTSEDLQSANEQLETSNEEMKSTNEELETTNEELQSMNEELETTNEELQALNLELDEMSEALESRTRELNALTARYAETLQQMPWPIILVDRNETVQLCNSAAQKRFDVGGTSVFAVGLDELPLEQPLRQALLRRCRLVLSTGKASVLRGQHFNQAAFDIQFSPISHEAEIDGVLVVFGPPQVIDAPASVKKAKKVKK